MMINRLCRWIWCASRLGLGMLAAFCLTGAVGCSSLPLERSADLEVQCRKDMQQAVQLRGLQLNRQIAIERESPEMLVKALAGELDKPENQVFLSDTGVLLRQLRVINKDQDLKSLFLKVMGQQVAAYYDPEKKRVAYVEGTSSKAFTNSAAMPVIDRFVYVHEFCHAVEDSHFDLERLTRESMSDFDRNMALTSLVEGDAMLVGLDSVFAEAPVNTATPFGAFAVQMIGRMDLSDEVKMMGDCPGFLSGALLRPYLDGGVFANRIRREAGWKAIDSIYKANLPQTSAEILYPERRFLRGFKPVIFKPEATLFASAPSGVMTNRLGAIGISLWLSMNKLAQPHQYDGFLQGWMGDQIYFLKACGGDIAQTIWLSYWEHTSDAKAFGRKAEQRLSDTFSGTAWSVQRDGHLVAIVWSDALSTGNCKDVARRALGSNVECGSAGTFRAWCRDLPWPIRWTTYGKYSRGAELLGGHVLDMSAGEDFFRFNLADGLILRAENNPDRCYWGTLAGLLRYVSDARSDFTFWRIPVLASWFRRGEGLNEQYAWRVLWGLGAYGSERKAAVLLIPVWHADVTKAN